MQPLKLPEIFLGFAAKDRYSIAESLLYHFENYGIPVWYDRHDLIIGDNREIENFQNGIIKNKYSILVFSENTESCVCLNEEIDVVYKKYRDGSMRVFPILYNITYDQLPPKYSWVDEIIYREVTDKSGTGLTVSSIVCRYLTDIANEQQYNDLKSFVFLSLNFDANQYIQELLSQYYSIDHNNLNARLTILYCLYSFLKLKIPVVQTIPIIKSIEWLFELTKLNLDIDFKELRIAEKALLILLNTLNDYYAQK